MFITFDKKQFYVRSDNGLILSTKAIPEGIIQAVLTSDKVITITTKNGVLIYHRVGNSPVFNFYRRY